MPLIHVGYNTYARVSDVDFPYLSQYRWFVSRGYAVTEDQLGLKYHMHRMVFREFNIVGMYVDHIDRNRLNNERGNLRLCSAQQNSWNTSKAKGTTSQYKGVTKSRDKWQARISKDGESRHLGVSETQVEAAVAYDQAAKELFGEFACLNFPTTPP